jgi:autotransporter-associated beta strand protein
MKISHRFRIAGLIAASLSPFAQTAGFSAEVDWSSPAATDSPAATLWLNDSTGATTYSQGLLQLNGSRDGLAITGPGGAADAGWLTLLGPTAVIRTGLTAGIQSLNVGTITTSGDWQIDGSGQLVVNAQIIDPLGDVSKITKTGVGTLLLNGASTYTGGTTLSQGTLLARNDRAFGTGALVFNGGAIGSADSTPHTFGNAMVALGDLTVGDSIDALGALTFTSHLDLGDDQRRITTKSNATFAGAIGNGGLTKDGLGALILSGTNTYARGTTLIEGSLLAATDAAFGTGVLNLNGGILGSNRGSRTFNNLVSMAAGTIQFGDADHLDALTFTGNTSLSAGRHTFNTVANTTFSGVIEGQSASLIKSGMGVLTLSNLNSYDGGTDLQAGTVRLANDSSIGRGAITFNGGTLASASNETRAITNDVVFNGSATIGDGSNTGAFLFLGTRNDLGGLTRTITTNVSTTVSNGLVGTGGLIKTGLESLTLRGASSFTGDTAVQRGRLVLDGTLASRNVTVAGGASFGGHGRFEGVLSGAGSVDPGSSPGILTVGQVDPRSAGSTSFNFEFTQTGAPNWSNASASGNDVLRITDTASPFLASLGNDNIINLYFSPSLTSTFTASAFTTVQGGFFTDKSNSNSLASAIAGANFQYYFEDPRGSVVYNSHKYLTQVEARANGLLPNYGQSFFVRTARVALANFASTSSTGGFVMQVVSRGTLPLVVVPEPSTWAMTAMALGAAAVANRRRVFTPLSRDRTAKST